MSILYVRFSREQVFKYVYAQSAWHCAHHTDARIITADQQKLLLVKLCEGIADFLERFDGYIESSTVPTLVSPDLIFLSIDFKFNREKSENYQESLKQNIIALLANFILMKIYTDANDQSSKALAEIFGNEWRRLRSKIMMSFSVEQLGR